MSRTRATFNMSRTRATFVAFVMLLGLTSCARSFAAPDKYRGWLDWRGPQQDGTSLEKGLPDKWALGGVNDLWHIDISGGGTPVIANGRLFGLGYRGEGPDLQEVLFAADAETGKM